MKEMIQSVVGTVGDIWFVANVRSAKLRKLVPQKARRLPDFLESYNELGEDWICSSTQKQYLDIALAQPIQLITK